MTQTNLVSQSVVLNSQNEKDPLDYQYIKGPSHTDELAQRILSVLAATVHGANARHAKPTFCSSPGSYRLLRTIHMVHRRGDGGSGGLAIWVRHAPYTGEGRSQPVRTYAVENFKMSCFYIIGAFLMLANTFRPIRLILHRKAYPYLQIQLVPCKVAIAGAIVNVSA